MVYIEVSNIKDFSLRVWSQQRLIAGSKILKEGEKVCRIRRAIAKANNNSSCRKMYFKPNNIRVGRFNIQEPCNRCAYVTVNANPTFRMKTTVKVIVSYVKVRLWKSCIGYVHPYLGNFWHSTLISTSVQEIEDLRVEERMKISCGEMEDFLLSLNDAPGLNTDKAM